MELIVKVDENEAKQFIGFLKTLEHVEVKSLQGRKLSSIRALTTSEPIPIGSWMRER